MTTPTSYTRYRDYSQFQSDNPNTDLNGADCFGSTTLLSATRRSRRQLKGLVCSAI
jgi:hypothetical protein